MKPGVESPHCRKEFLLSVSVLLQFPEPCLSSSNARAVLTSALSSAVGPHSDLITYGNVGCGALWSIGEVLIAA